MTPEDEAAFLAAVHEIGQDAKSAAERMVRLERERDAAKESEAKAQYECGLVESVLEIRTQERDALRAALRELVRIDDLPGMCMPGWEAAIGRARSVLGETP